MNNHSHYISKTYELARMAQNNGNHPFGALMVIDNIIVLTAENTVNTEQDITKHAELNLVSLATQQLKRSTIEKSILYTSTEPCAMCAGAIFWAGINTVVFGCSAENLGEQTTGSFVVPCKDVFAYASRKTIVIGPILETEGIEIHQSFWS